MACVAHHSVVLACREGLHLACRLFKFRGLVRALVEKERKIGWRGEETVFEWDQWEKWASRWYWVSQHRWKMGMKE